MRELKRIAYEAEEVFKHPKSMNDLTADEENEFENATFCHICEQRFNDNPRIIHT